MAESFQACFESFLTPLPLNPIFGVMSDPPPLLKSDVYVRSLSYFFFINPKTPGFFFPRDIRGCCVLPGKPKKQHVSNLVMEAKTISEQLQFKHQDEVKFVNFFIQCNKQISEYLLFA